MQYLYTTASISGKIKANSISWSCLVFSLIFISFARSSFCSNNKGRQGVAIPVKQNTDIFDAASKSGALISIKTVQSLKTEKGKITGWLHSLQSTLVEMVSRKRQTCQNEAKNLCTICV